MAFPKRSGTDPKYQTREHRDYRTRLLTQLRRDGYLICTAKICVLPSGQSTTNRDGEGSWAVNNPNPPITTPKKVDPQWRDKIERAKRARELSHRMRLGKQISFRSAVGRAG